MVTLSKIIEGLEMVDDINIIQDWYKYKDEKYKEIAIDWCKQNELEYK